MTTRTCSGPVDRRSLPRSSALLGSALFLGNRASFAHVSVPSLKVDTRTVEVNKKSATVFCVTGPSERSKFSTAEVDRFSGAPLAKAAWIGLAPSPTDFVPMGTSLRPTMAARPAHRRMALF